MIERKANEKKGGKKERKKLFLKKKMSGLWNSQPDYIMIFFFILFFSYHPHFVLKGISSN